MKRLLDCTASDFESMSKHDILDAISLSEGRVLVSEIVSSLPSALTPLTQGEIVAAFGADIILCNMVDVDTPFIHGIEDPHPIKRLKELTGRLIGVNLEPVDESINSDLVSFGRRATVENVIKAKKLGFDFIVLTGNPNTKVSHHGILNAITAIRKELRDSIMIISGKMHGAGSHKTFPFISERDVLDFIQAGTDVLLLPAPGTVPGVGVDDIKNLVNIAHHHKVLTMTAIGTSQEDADVDTIKTIALWSKMTGTDIHHIGDVGYRSAPPENIMAYSIAIRGKRHTYARMARSIKR